jgi:hypothetical protein
MPRVLSGITDYSAIPPLLLPVCLRFFLRSLTDNSSRFGKWMKVGLNGHFLIQGCEIINYLLEKSRVVTQSTMEVKRLLCGTCA